MAAFTGTPTSSLQYADQLTSQMVDPVIGIGKLQVGSFKYTHTAGAGTGAINLIELPGGLLRVFVDLCRIVSSARRSPDRNRHACFVTRPRAELPVS